MTTYGLKLIRKTLRRLTEKLAVQKNLTIEANLTYAQVAQPCDDKLSAHLREAIKKADAHGLYLSSSATHDASAMADLCPIAMLFVKRGSATNQKNSLRRMTWVWPFPLLPFS